MLIFFNFFFFFFFFNDTATTEIYTLFPTRRSSDLEREGREHCQGQRGRDEPARCRARVGGSHSLTASARPNRPEGLTIRTTRMMNSATLTFRSPPIAAM